MSLMDYVKIDENILDKFANQCSQFNFTLDE